MYLRVNLGVAHFNKLIFIFFLVQW